MTKEILNPNNNCSPYIKLKRFGILIDSDEYYRAFFNVADRAKSSINIHGWEFDSRLLLSHVNNHFPDSMRDYLTSLVKRNKNLVIKIRSWKSSFYLRFGRERFANLKWRMQTPPRIDYRQIRHFALYGSLHEKIAIIDDSCAFLGGIDITKKRWDTTEHNLVDPRRIDPYGNIYHPIHDVQVVCSREIAHELNHKILNHPSSGPSDLWPQTPFFQIEDVDVSLSRTDSKQKVTEIENLYYDAILSAKELIYIENQYLSNENIFSLICKKLEDPIGPEVIIVTPYSYRGLFEKAIYQYRRDKILRALKRSDNYSRLGVYYPVSSGQRIDGFIVVHSKIMIIDNRFMTIGSANLNYRSMRLDNELNISFETVHDERIKGFITSIFHKLLSEHLGTTAEKISSLGSVGPLTVIKTLQNRGQKDLVDLELLKNPLLNLPMILLAPLIDMKYPLPKRYLYLFLFGLFIFISLVFYLEIK